MFLNFLHRIGAVSYCNLCFLLILTSFMTLRHLNYHSLVRNREKPYFKKGAITHRNVLIAFGFKLKI